MYGTLYAISKAGTYLLGSAYLIYVPTHGGYLRYLLFGFMDGGWWMVVCGLRGLAHCSLCSAVIVTALCCTYINLVRIFYIEVIYE